ncbi:MAG: hypothetical protein IKT52_04845 [Oscillospiraceae bacterium]|nr:hypothetical protein [Oscillospiraceae bacterium]
MKKVMSLLLALVMCLSLCACGGNDTSKTTDAPTETTAPTVNKATVITNEGETVEVSAQDLFNEYDANEARFAKIYGGATIEFVGTVKYIKIETNVYNGESVSAKQNKIVFEEGWCLILGADSTLYDLADYYPGQKLKVTTGIVSPAFDTEFLQTTADNNRVVWLVGNDKLNGKLINTQATTITIEE